MATLAVFMNPVQFAAATPAPVAPLTQEDFCIVLLTMACGAFVALAIFSRRIMVHSLAVDSANFVTHSRVSGAVLLLNFLLMVNALVFGGIVVPSVHQKAADFFSAMLPAKTWGLSTLLGWAGLLTIWIFFREDLEAKILGLFARKDAAVKRSGSASSSGPKPS